MLQWFKDAALMLPITPTTPKWVSIPTKGGVKTASVWLGDAYTSIVAQDLTSSATTIFVTQVDEFPATGTITIDLEQITYAGVSTTPPSLTGCIRGVNSTTAAAHTVGAVVFPQITHTGSGNISVLVSGMPLSPNTLRLARVGFPFGPPGAPLLLPVSTVSSGVAGAIQINLQFTALPGLEKQYNNLGVTITPVTRPGDEVSGFSTITEQPLGNLFVQQRDQGLAQHLRLLPLSRKVADNLPGFEWGQYRWRDETTENQHAIVPTRWDIDTSLITQDFIGGVGSIGETNDLEPIDLEEVESSIFMRAQHGQYFTGVKRYFFPSDNFNLEFLPCYPSLPFTYQLLNPPREQTPVFVGRWRLDGQGFYEFDTNLRYRFPGTFDPVSTQAQFMVDRKTGILTVNAAAQIPQTTILLGVLSGGVQEFFDMPFYPLDKIVTLFVGNPFVVIPAFTFDREDGSVTFPKAPGTSQGQPLFATVNAAIAVLYEFDVPDLTEVQNTNIPDEAVLKKDTRLLAPDLNPAFSGLANGHVYLQHRVLKPVSVQLSADKPQIAIPPTFSTIVGLIAYGPVFYNGDFALLTAKAIGSLPNEVVPGSELQVVPGGFNPQTGLPLQNYPFRGLINGLDPNTNTITVITGGDGIANLVFQPEPDFGFYIPTTAPWVTSSTTFMPTVATWTSGVATLTFSSPLSDEFQVGTSIRLAGFTPSDWDGDYAITVRDPIGVKIKIAIANDPGPVTIMGTVGPLDTLLLPVPIPISQIWAGPTVAAPATQNEGWLDFLYSVLSNDPLFGLSTYLLAGHNADVTGGVATVRVSQIVGLTFNPGQSITITGATSPQLDGTFSLLTAMLASGVWTLTFNDSNGNFTSTAQTAGVLTTTGSLPYTTNGTVNGDVSINSVSWTAGIATYNLASTPTNLEPGQNIDIVGCTTSTLNGFQNVLTVGPGNVITAPTSTPGTGSEAESGATIQYSNFRSNGVLAVWNKIIRNWQASTPYQVGDQILDSNGNVEQVTSISGSGTSGFTQPTWAAFTFPFPTTTDNPGGNQIVWTNIGRPGPSTSIPIHAFDKHGNDYTSSSFNGNVVQLQFNTGLPNPSQGFVQAYLFQFLEREIIQMRVVGTNIYSNSIMLQMQTPTQILNNPYLVLSTDQTQSPFYANADINSRLSINRLGITPTP